MCALAAVGVHDDLTAGKTSVAMRATDNKLSGGVYVIGDVVVEKGQDFLAGDGFLDTRDEDVNDVVAYLLLHGLVAGKLVVLGAHHDSVDSSRYVLVAILDGNLAL